MKKVVFIFIIMLLFMFIGCSNNGEDNKKDDNQIINYNDILDKAIDKIDIKQETSSDISFVKNVKVDDYDVIITWNVEKKATDERSNIDNNGKVTLPVEEDALFVLKATVSINNETKDKEYLVILLSYKTLCIKASEKIELPSSVNDDIELPEEIDGINIEWYSSNEQILSKLGKCSYVNSTQNIKMSAAFSIDYDDNSETKTFYYDKDYDVAVNPYSFERRVEIVTDNIVFKDTYFDKVPLPTTLDYDLDIIWVSSNKEFVDDNGIIVKTPSEDKVVKFEATIGDKLNGINVAKVTFDVKIGARLENEEELEFPYHNIIDYTSNFSRSHLKNLVFNNEGKVVIADGETSGTYESRIFHTKNFKSLVGSWSCITSPNATIELEISLLIGDKWSKYYTYGVWGLGKTNTYYNQTDSATNSKMSVDEIIVNSGNATGCKYRVTLRRNNASTDSPVLSLVCLALEISESNYSYPVDVSSLPKSVDNNLPKLYQYDVPNIGGSICSATTTTMLLKWKGHSFTDKGKTYEHEYIAELVADPGHNSPTYGNWSYNMAVAGAYGDNAYVARMYSWEEVMYHLATVGPMGASIRSSNGEWGYNTNGHLVVVRGYRISDSGSVTVICNDPAVRNVYYEVTLSQFLQCWRGVTYVIEK